MNSNSDQPHSGDAFEQAHSRLGARLVRRWIEFGRLLRRNGVQVTPGQVRDLLRALSYVDMSHRDEVYFTARALLCARRDDLPRFDLTFRQFWGRTRQIIIPSDTGSMNDQQSQVRQRPGADQERERKQDRKVPLIERSTLADSEDGTGSGERGGDENPQQVLLYSTQERLRKLDFARFNEEELQIARAILASWEWKPGERRTRRLAPTHRGHRFDFPRTLRRAMRTSGVPFTLATRGPRMKPRPLVLISDISGSMAPYTRMLLFFLHTLRRGVGRAEVFVFGTRLTRITRQLRVRDVDQALEEVGKRVVDWSGGTRIGEALRDFNTNWARRVMGQGAVVCIISDGWDRGDPLALATEMAYLQRMAYRLIWLNPLLGISGYQPLTRGMAAALPFVDDFLPANNLASLYNLAQLLSGIQLHNRPERRQVILPPANQLQAAQPKPRFDVQVGVSRGTG